MTIPNEFAFVAIRMFQNPTFPRPAEWTFGIDVNEVIDPDPVDIAGDIGAELEATNIESVMSENTRISEIFVKLGPDATGLSGSAAVTIDGTIASHPLPPNAAVLVAKGTSLGGRKGRGRMFVPIGTESFTGPGGALDSGYRDSVQAVMDDFLGKLAAASKPMHLLHSGVEAPNEVLTLTVSGRLATQRRRLRR